MRKEAGPGRTGPCEMHRAIFIWKKSFSRPSSTVEIWFWSLIRKTGIWGPSAIKSVYFFCPLVVLMVIFAWFGRNQIYEIPQLSNLFIFRSLGCFRGWFSHNVMTSPTCEVHVMVGPTCHVASFFLSPLALPHEPLCHTSPSCSFALHAPSQEPAAISLVFLHRTSSSSLDDDRRAPSFWIEMRR
jgi:hypothetical protein